MSRTRTACGLLLVLVLTACPAEIEEAREDPQEVVAEFVSAWNEEDFETMHHLLIDSPSQQRWHSGALRYYWNKLTKKGRIRDFEVTMGERVGGDSGFSYSITYESDAVEAPIVLADGRLRPVERDGSWYLEWNRFMPFAGEGARAFQMKERWGRRGAIRDRNGRLLAAGIQGSRRYPLGAVAGTTVGHLGAPSKTGPQRYVGASGLEEAFDERLAGVPDRRLTLVGPGGEVVRRFGWIDGRDGRDVKTTLDVDVQKAAEPAFGPTVGGAVVLQPSTGDILAAVSSSAFDPGNYVGAENVEPFNRALSGRYPPGSSLKVMTAAAALDTGEVRPSTSLTGPKEYRGVRNFESGEFGTIDFATALEHSVNTAFAQVALRLGPRKLFRYSNAFGFNSPPTMALEAGTSSFPKPLDEGDLMWGSIGQAQVLATPLQMATVAATIANDGRRMEPRIDLARKPEGDRVVKVETARTLTELMRAVVTGGTGVAANVTGLEVAGKTGTAEVDVGGERKNHAWFVCFAPAGDPKVAVAVVAEYGGIGGQVAAPLARSILTSVWPHLR